jgi:hypothetical protein
MLSNRDVASLTWYFGEGISAFERSTFGPMLERAEAFHVPWELRRPANDVTARPTAETRHHGGVEPDHKLLVRYGEVSRRLQGCTPTARAVLEAMHGDLGARWARHERGRFVALFHLTASGKRLLEHARNRASASQLELSDQERLKTEIEVDHVKGGKDSIRRALITKATREAQELYRVACGEYAATGEAKEA